MAKPVPESPVATMAAARPPDLAQHRNGVRHHVDGAGPGARNLEVGGVGEHMLQAGERAGDEIGVRCRIPARDFLVLQFVLRLAHEHAPDRIQHRQAEMELEDSSG